jgi:hypothetical protein
VIARTVRIAVIASVILVVFMLVAAPCLLVVWLAVVGVSFRRWPVGGLGGWFLVWGDCARCVVFGGVGCVAVVGGGLGGFACVGRLSAGGQSLFWLGVRSCVVSLIGEGNRVTGRAGFVDSIFWIDRALQVSWGVWLV